MGEGQEGQVEVAQPVGWRRGKAMPVLGDGDEAGEEDGEGVQVSGGKKSGAAGVGGREI